MNKTKNNGVIYHSIDFKKEYYEDPEKLGHVLVSLINSVLNSADLHSRQEKPRYVFTEVEEIKNLNKLNFCFECYDVADKEQEEIFISKLSVEGKERYTNSVI